MGKRFEQPNVYDVKSISDVTLDGARFVGCSVSAGFDKVVMPVRHVTLTRSRVEGALVESFHLVDVTVDGCETKDAIRLHDCFFDRVVARGRLGRWHIDAPLQRETIAAFGVAFYTKVDWALDLRDAQFDDALVRGIPPEKIKRDPERHIAPRRERLLRTSAWRKLEPALVRRLELFLRLGRDELIVACEGAPSFEVWKDRGRRLRAAGLAD